MASLAVVMRLILAGVFALAGLAKLLDRDGTRELLGEFGVPAWARGAAALALPVGELTVAATLVPTPMAWWASIGALLMLAVFTLATCWAIGRGLAVECHCFGQIGSTALGWRTVARNLVLVAAASVVVARGRAQESVASWATGISVSGATVALVALALLAAAQFAFSVGLLRQNGRILRRLEALESGGAQSAFGPHDPRRAGPVPGTSAPSFALQSLAGEVVTSDDLRSRADALLLVFLDPDCRPCTSLLPDVTAAQRAAGRDVAVAVVSRGSPERNRAKFGEHAIGDVLLQKANEVREAFALPGTPSAVVIARGGAVASPGVLGVDDVRRVLSAVASTGRLPGTALAARGADPHGQAGLPLGTPIPNVELLDAEGTSTPLAEVISADTVILFWSERCGFCRSMRAQLQTRLASDGSSPQLLVVSTIPLEAGAPTGLDAAVLADRDRAAQTAFGARGTPMAVRLRDGRVASELAAGADAVLALLEIDAPARSVNGAK